MGARPNLADVVKMFTIAYNERDFTRLESLGKTLHLLEEDLELPLHIALWCSEIFKYGDLSRRLIISTSEDVKSFTEIDQASWITIASLAHSMNVNLGRT